MKDKEFWQRTSAVCAKMITVAETMEATELMKELCWLKLECDRRLWKVTEDAA